jgi:hypothetical protein
LLFYIAFRAQLRQQAAALPGGATNTLRCSSSSEILGENVFYFIAAAAIFYAVQAKKVEVKGKHQFNLRDTS